MKRKTFGIFFVGLIFVALANNQYFSYGYYPGDDGDTGFIIYLLEYLNNKIIINSDFSNIFNANFGYPWPNNLLRSETMLGLFPIFALIRGLGFDVFTSYQIFFISLIFLNFLSAFIFTCRFGIRPIFSAIGAFVFCSSLPIIAQDVHSHLLFRAFIPPAIYYINRFFSEDINNTNDLLKGLSCLFAQIICGLYVGLFLLVYLLIYVIFLSYYYRFRFFKVNLNSLKLHNILIFIILFGSLISLFFKYLNFNRDYSLARSFNKDNLIHWQSFFLGDRLDYWGYRVSDINIPTHENQWFLGLGIIFLLLWFLLYRIKIEKSTKIITIAVVVNITLFFNLNWFSPYAILNYLPVFSAVRLPVRSIVVLIYPISILIAYATQKIYGRLISSKYLFILYILLGAIFIESALAKRTLTNSNEIQQRQLALKKSVIESIGKNYVFVVRKSYSPIDTSDVDVMMVTIGEGYSSINMFTSFLPPVWVSPTSCEAVKDYVTKVGNYSKLNPTKNINPLFYEEISFVGFEGPCR